MSMYYKIVEGDKLGVKGLVGRTRRGRPALASVKCVSPACQLSSSPGSSLGSSPCRQVCSMDQSHSKSRTTPVHSPATSNIFPCQPYLYLRFPRAPSSFVLHRVVQDLETTTLTATSLLSLVVSSFLSRRLHLLPTRAFVPD